jgi:hypothetical protein
VSVVARVLSRGEHHGVLVIAGVPLSAQLPPEIGRTDETLRLSVTDVTPERVTMQLDQVINPAAQPPRTCGRPSPRLSPGPIRSVTRQLPRTGDQGDRV